MTLILTGASGPFGRTAAETLLDRADPAELVLVSRRPEQLADLAERGATVRFGDFDDPASLDAAFAGGTRLLLVSTPVIGPERVAQHVSAVDAAVRAGVAHVSYTSLPNPAPDNPAMVASDHRATEEHIRASGLRWTFLRNTLYGDLRAGEAAAAGEHGAFSHNLGDGRAAFVARRDCAAAAAAVLAGGDEHDGQLYDVTGPELLDGDDLARIYGEVGGTTVVAHALDDDAYRSELVSHGVPEAVAPLLVGFGRAIREGYLDQQTDVVERLTGRPAAPLADVLATAGA